MEIHRVILSDKAKAFLKKECRYVGSCPCPHCGKPTEGDMDSSVYETVDLGSLGAVSLYEYRLKGHLPVREAVTKIDVSGPCIAIYATLAELFTKDGEEYWKPNKDFA